MWGNWPRLNERILEFMNLTKKWYSRWNFMSLLIFDNSQHILNKELVRVDTENISTTSRWTRLLSMCIQYIFENQALDNFALHPSCSYLDFKTLFIYLHWGFIPYLWILQAYVQLVLLHTAYAFSKMKLHGHAGGRVVSVHAVYAADPVSFSVRGPLLHVTSPSLSHTSSLSAA